MVAAFAGCCATVVGCLTLGSALRKAVACWDRVVTEVVDLDPDDVKSFDPGPLSPRSRPGIAATDDHLVVWGGVDGNLASVEGGISSGDEAGDEVPLFDGAMFDFATSTWREMSNAPEELKHSGAIATAGRSDEVALAVNDRVALYHPADDTFELLPVTPFKVSSLAFDSSLELLLAESPNGIGYYDLTNNTWEVLAAFDWNGPPRVWQWVQDRPIEIRHLWSQVPDGDELTLSIVELPVLDTAGPGTSEPAPEVARIEAGLFRGGTEAISRRQRPIDRRIWKCLADRYRLR